MEKLGGALKGIPQPSAESRAILGLSRELTDHVEKTLLGMDPLFPNHGGITAHYSRERKKYVWGGMHPHQEFYRRLRYITKKPLANYIASLSDAAKRNKALAKEIGSLLARCEAVSSKYTEPRVRQDVAAKDEVSMLQDYGEVRELLAQTVGLLARHPELKERHGEYQHGKKLYELMKKHGLPTMEHADTLRRLITTPSSRTKNPLAYSTYKKYVEAEVNA
jgi:hypothetical protein